MPDTPEATRRCQEIAIHVVLAALIASHPDPERFRDALKHAQESAMADMLAEPMSDDVLEAVRFFLTEFERYSHLGPEL